VFGNFPSPEFSSGDILVVFCLDGCTDTEKKHILRWIELRNLEIHPPTFPSVSVSSAVYGSGRRRINTLRARFCSVSSLVSRFTTLSFLFLARIGVVTLRVHVTLLMLLPNGTFDHQSEFRSCQFCLCVCSRNT